MVNFKNCEVFLLWSTLAVAGCTIATAHIVATITHPLAAGGRTRVFYWAAYEYKPKQRPNGQ